MSGSAVAAGSVRIFDTTLRDGEQAPGAGLTAAEKLEVARQLARLKVDVSPIGAEDVVRAIDEIAGAPPDLLDYMKKLLADQKGGG